MNQQILSEWEAAFKAAYPHENLEYEAFEDHIISSNGLRYTYADLKMHTAKLKAAANQPTFTMFSDSPAEREELVNAIKLGNQGNLIIGKFLQNRYERGRTKLHNLEAWLKDQGLKLPAESTRSKYRQAYETWVRNAGLSLHDTYYHDTFTTDRGGPIPMTLQGVSTYALYEARNLVTKDNAVEMLARCYTSTIDELKDAASNANKALEPMEEVRSLPKVPKSVYERFSSLTEAFPHATKLEVIEFMIEFISDLSHTNPSVFNEAVAAYFGEHDKQ